jgi:hypothetical protein
VVGGNAALFRNAPWLFTGFGLAVIAAFWPTYYSRLDAQAGAAHAHGIVMTLWCALLVVQGWLIKAGGRQLHARLGTLSYVLAPLVVVATVVFLRERFGGVRALGPVELYFLALVLNGLVAFVAIYGLAILFRRRAAVHARFMVCTVFPLFTPVTDRLIGRYAPSLVPLVPRIDGTPILPAAGFALADAMLLALSIWDWRANRRAIFPVALALLLVYHWSVLTFHEMPFWRKVGEWFLAL